MRYAEGVQKERGADPSAFAVSDFRHRQRGELMLHWSQVIGPMGAGMIERGDPVQRYREGALSTGPTESSLEPDWPLAPGPSLEIPIL